jgi:hypothetical protein
MACRGLGSGGRVRLVGFVFFFCVTSFILVIFSLVVVLSSLGGLT